MKVVEPAGYAPASAACKAAVLLLNEGPLVKMARRSGAAPDPRSFGDSAAQAGARRVKMVRSAGVAPASPDWHTGILLLNDDRVTQRLRPAVGQCVPPASAMIKAEGRLEALRHGSRDGLRYGARAARITARRAPVCTKERTPLRHLPVLHPRDFSADVLVF